MLRGFRWQLIALISALFLFAAGLSTRLSNPEPPAATPASALQTADETAAPTLLPTPSPGVLIGPQASQQAVVTFREGVIGSVVRLNPLLAAPDSAEQDITSLIFEGLTAINTYGEPVPNLAESWVISSNGLEYVMRLRQDVLWQDGIPFTAADVAFTMSLLRAPDFPGPSEFGAFWRTVETEQLGDNLVRFRLTQPLGSFLDKLRISILPFHALQGMPASALLTHPFNLSPIGTGPYQLEALRTTDGSSISEVDLRVAPVYRQRPEGQTGYEIERLRFRVFGNFDTALGALANDEIDGLAAPSRAERPPLMSLLDKGNLNVATGLEPRLGIIIYNWQRETTRFFREQRVRLALETGSNRAPVIERWLLNEAVQADSPLIPGSWAYISDLVWPSYDANAANLLLDTANLSIPTPEGEANESTDSPRLRFTVLTPNDPALVNLVTEIIAQWAQLDISAAVTAADPDAYQARLDSGDFDAALVELSLEGSADPDVYAFWHQGQYPDGANYGGVDDRRISELLERARQEPSNLNRAIHYAQFQRVFVDRAIALPLYYPLFTYAASRRTEGIQIGFISRHADRFQTLKDWRIAAP